MQLLLCLRTGLLKFILSAALLFEWHYLSPGSRGEYNYNNLHEGVYTCHAASHLSNFVSAFGDNACMFIKAKFGSGSMGFAVDIEGSGGIYKRYGSTWEKIV